MAGKKGANTNQPSKKKTEAKNNESESKTNEIVKVNGNPRANSGGSQSNSLIWFFIFVITIGIGVGAFYILEEVKHTNSGLANQIISLKAELETLNSFKDKAQDLETQLNALNSFKDEFQAVKDEQLSNLKSAELTSNENKLNLEKMSKIIYELKQQLNSNQEELKLAEANTKASVEKLENFVRDSLKVVETNIEGFSGDINRVNLQTKSQQTEVSNLKEELKSVANLISKNEDKVEQNKKTTDDQYIFLQETVIGQFQESTNNKFSTLEKTTVDAVSGLSQQLESATLSLDAFRNKQEVDAASVNEKLGRCDTLREVAVTALHKESDALQSRQAKLENDLAKLDVGSFATEAYVLDAVEQKTTTVNNNIKQNSDGILNLKDAVDKSSSRVETQISTLTSHVKSAKKDVASVKDDIIAAIATIEEIKTTGKSKENESDLKAKTPV